ncbi:MAG: glutathione S-transferase C-terminal domain-containing protein, partial [Acetobacteraceae bacterium]
DGETVVFDSERIADHLETRYPDRPSLFGGAAGRALARFLHHWTVQMLHPEISRLVLPDLFPRLAETDRAYFRASREAALGLKIEDLPAQRAERLVAFARALAPLRTLLETQPYLSGTAPLYADHIVFGAFQWARVASPLVLVAPEDPVAAWRERMLDAYGGLGRAMAAAA